MIHSEIEYSGASVWSMLLGYWKYYNPTDLLKGVRANKQPGEMQ